MNLLDLANKLDRVAENLPLEINALKRDVATAVLNDLTQTTPADVGSAISNWQVSIDEPASDSISAYVPSPRGRMIKGVWTHTVDPMITARANIPPTFEVGKIVISSAAPSHAIFIASLLPYISVLNEGSSDQVPAGFVDRAVILGQSVIDRNKLLR